MKHSTNPSTITEWKKGREKDNNNNNKITQILTAVGILLVVVMVELSRTFLIDCDVFGNFFIVGFWSVLKLLDSLGPIAISRRLRCTNDSSDSGAIIDADNNSLFACNNSAAKPCRWFCKLGFINKINSMITKNWTKRAILSNFHALSSLFLDFFFFFLAKFFPLPGSFLALTLTLISETFEVFVCKFLWLFKFAKSNQTHHGTVWVTMGQPKCLAIKCFTVQYFRKSDWCEYIQTNKVKKERRKKRNERGKREKKSISHTWFFTTQWNNKS